MSTTYNTPGRTMTADMVSEVTTAQLAPVLLTELQFDTANPTRLWSGYGTLSYNSVSWIGVGDLGLEFVTAIQEKTIYWGNPNASTPVKWTAPDSDAGNQP